jgi:glycosyltransferase involved in cell wall biosynthesis
MPESPEVTIVTVTRNNLGGLQETRTSVLSLKDISYEHLVVDGASTDGTTTYLQENFAPGTWSSKPDHGPYDAMNHGIQQAHGKWILFLNAGDTLKSSENFKTLLCAANCGEAVVAYGDHVFNKKIRQASEFRILHKELLEGNIRFWLRYHPCHQATIIRTDFIKGQTYDLNYQFAADFYWLEKTRQLGARMLYQPGVICEYQAGGLSSQNLPRCLAEWHRIIQLECHGENPAARAYLHRMLKRHLRQKAKRRGWQQLWGK